MAQIIDALFVTLGLDTKAFKKGKDDAVKIDADLTKKTKKGAEERRHQDKENEKQNKKQSQEFRKQTKENVESVKKFRNQLLTIGAIFTGGLGMLAFAKSTILTSANIGRLGNDFDMSAKKVRAWQMALETVGGTSSGMSQSLARASQTISFLKTGVGDSSQYVGMQTMAGVAGMNLPGKFSDPAQVLLAQSKMIQRIAQQRGMAVAFQQANHWLGMDQATFDLLKKGPKYVQQLVKSQEPLAESQARLSDRAQRLQRKLVTLKGTLESTGVTILTDLMPIFDRLVGKFQDFAKWLDQHKTQINQWMDSATKSTERFATQADKVAQALGGWKTVIEGLMALKIASLITKLTGLSGALGALSAGRFGALMGALGVGYAVGTKISDSGIIDAEHSDNLGRKIARVMALLGDKDAQYAISHDKKQTRFQRIENWISPKSAVNANTSTNSVNINKIEIHTQATDANGIARDIVPALTRYSIFPQLTTGVK